MSAEGEAVLDAANCVLDAAIDALAVETLREGSRLLAALADKLEAESRV